MKNAISVICVAAVDAFRSDAIVGRAGRYMSMANGPIALIRPRTTAFLRKGEDTVKAPGGPADRPDMGPAEPMTTKLLVKCDGAATGRPVFRIGSGGGG